jgi:hypothetical protein
VVSITLRPRFTPGEKTPGIHWPGGWVDPRAGLDAKARVKILCLCQGSNLGRPVRSHALYCLSYPAKCKCVIHEPEFNNTHTVLQISRTDCVQFAKLNSSTSLHISHNFVRYIASCPTKFYSGSLDADTTFLCGNYVISNAGCTCIVSLKWMSLYFTRLERCQSQHVGVCLQWGQYLKLCSDVASTFSKDQKHWNMLYSTDMLVTAKASTF